MKPGLPADGGRRGSGAFQANVKQGIQGLLTQQQRDDNGTKTEGIRDERV